MRSATSCSKTLIRSDWRRFWPAAFLYAFISFFMLPLPVWVNRELTDGGTLWGGRRAAQVVREMSPGFVILVFFFGLILAMAVYSYLMAGKSVGLMHALPVSRNRQFLSHFAAALSMLTAGNAVTFLLALLMEALTRSVEIKSLLVWLAVTELTGFFFLAFATLCTVITGWLLAVPAIYVGFNFVVWAYEMILKALAGLLYPNVTNMSHISGAALWLTPAAKLVDVAAQRVYTVYERGLALTNYGYNPELLPALLIYTAVGLAMLGLALVLYRRRHSESAGDAVAFKTLRPVARYVISIAAGLALGTLAHQMITWGGRNAVSLILCQIIMGGVVFCAVEMLLRKSYKIFDRRMAAGLLALWLVLAGVTGAMALDVVGVQRRVPEADRVESVRVYGQALSRSVELTDPAAVQTVISLHRALIDSGEPAESWEDLYVEYELKDGSAMSRRFKVDLKNPAVYEAMTEMLNQPLMRRVLLLEEYGKYGTTFTGGYADCYTTGRTLVLSAQDCLKVYQALEADMERPVTPESLEDVASNFRVELVTIQGGYDLWQLRRDCRDTIATLIELGLIDSEADLEFGG